jgi:DNA-directed RNA polymerase specialized sigma24 family protein
MSNIKTIKKILFLASNPKDTSSLRLDQEVREIETGLQRSKHRDNFSLIQKWAVRSRDLRQALLDVKPQIVHFSGHGSSSGGIILENVTGESHLLPSEALAEIFELFSDEVECVVLNACYSETQAEAISQHVNFVIGMNQAIGDGAAIEFAVGFYDALGNGKSFKKAYKFGCNAIHLEGIPEHQTPVLKSKYNLGNSDLKDGSKIINWTLKLDITFNEVDKDKAEAFIEILRHLSKDSSITLKEIIPGSVVFLIESSEQGFNRIKRLFKQGRLTMIKGVSLLDVQLFVNKYIPNAPGAPISEEERLFKRFLVWLNYKGTDYEDVRYKLIKLFSYRNLLNAEELADETIDRVMLRFENYGIPFSNPIHYFLKVADHIFREQLRKPNLVELNLAQDMAEETHTDDLQFICLQKCLKKLSADEREFIKSYYDHEVKSKIEHRKALAFELKLSTNVLHRRAFKLREKLEECILECMKKEGE